MSVKYVLDSTNTLRAVNVFENAGRKAGDGRKIKNDSSEGYKLTNRSKNKIEKYFHGYFKQLDFDNKTPVWMTFTLPPLDGLADWLKYKQIATSDDVEVQKYNPEFHDSIFIKQWSKFLENLRKNHGLRDYLWVAERQNGKRNLSRGVKKEATNAIHFHAVFVFDRFVHASNLNMYWLRLCNEVGCPVVSLNQYLRSDLFELDKVWSRNKEYLKHPLPYLKSKKNQKGRSKLAEVIRMERAEVRRTLENQEFYKAFAGIPSMCINPNSILAKICYQPVDFQQIKDYTITKGKNKGQKVKAVESLSQYLTKYVTKNDSKIYGRAWGASRGFSSVNWDLELQEDEIQEIMQVPEIVKFEKSYDLEIGEAVFENTFYSLDYTKLLKTKAFSRYWQHIEKQMKTGIRNDNYGYQIEQGLVDYDTFTKCREKLTAFRNMSRRKEKTNDWGRYHAFDLQPNEQFEFEKPLPECKRGQKSGDPSPENIKALNELKARQLKVFGEREQGVEII